MNRLAELNEQIEQLKAERVALLNQRDFENEEVIKSLEWTKECYARLEVNTLVAAGLPTYNIVVMGKTPHCLRPRCVMGNSKNYEQNMMFGIGFLGDYPSFYTSSVDMLCEFLEKVTFQRFDFNEQHLRALKAAEAVQSR